MGVCMCVCVRGEGLIVLIKMQIYYSDTCSKGPCYNGGTCLSKVCLCPAFCHGHHCEECDKDPYPPQQSVNIDSISFNVIMDQGWIVSTTGILIYEI